jgi:predicted metal-binding membrane protein
VAYLRLTSGVGTAPLPLGILISLVALTGIAWALTVYEAITLSRPMEAAVMGGVAAEGMAGMAMSGMSAGGWSVANVSVFMAVWTAMMMAMMLPAALPMILTFAAAQVRRERSGAVPTWIFVAGYLLVWAAAGLLVYAIAQIAAALTTRIDLLDRETWAPFALGSTLIVAGLYQFTPLKRVCLHHCRSPLGFVARHWRDGRTGALIMGATHGLYCLGCCWALFAVLIVAGMMSLAWMLLLTLIIFAEKVLPHGPRLAAVVAAAFIVSGAMILIGAGWMSGPMT